EVLGRDDTRHRLAAAADAVRFARFARRRGHLLAVRWIPADRRVDSPPGHHFAPDERKVILLHLAILELARQRFVRGVVLVDDEQSRRAAIEAVDDAGPLLAADAAEIVDVMQ